MNHADLLQTLSGCHFYQDYQEARRPAEPPEPPLAKRPPQSVDRARIDLIFHKYWRLLGGLLAASVLLVIVPLWLVHPPSGKACLLSLPPMLLCSLSWMAGAWWAWDRSQYVLMAVTTGAMPVRLIFVLVWTWLVVMIPGISIVVFVPCLMWHWILFAVPEFAVLLELNQPPKKRPARARTERQTTEAPVAPWSECDEVPGELPLPHRRVRHADRGPGDAELAGEETGTEESHLEVLR